VFKRERLKQILKAQGRKKSWLAERLDVTPETISRYLKDKDHAVQKNTVLAICQVLAIAESELWDDDNKAKAS
jgi:DNA-binding Xre family transcriptional regulator